MIVTPVFVDTWGWVALGHRRDGGHARILAIYEELRAARTPLITSDFVLDEVATLLFVRERFDEAERFLEDLFEAVSRGQIVVEPITPGRFSRAWDFRRRYRDKPTISFTDLTSMAVMTELGLSRIVTEDRHFLQVGLGFELLP